MKDKIKNIIIAILVTIIILLLARIVVYSLSGDQRASVIVRDINVSYRCVSEWTEGDINATQYDIKIVNRTKNDISNWKIIYELNDKIDIDNIWNANAEYKANDVYKHEIIFTPVDYNNTITKSGDINFGLIIKSKGDIRKIFSDDRHPYKVFIDDKEYNVKDLLVANSNKGNVIKIDSNNIDSNNDSNNQNNNNNEQNNNGSVTLVDAKNIPDNTKGSPVSIHGKLKVSGTSIVDKNNEPFIIQGVSTHGIAWFPKYVNYDTFKYLRDECNVNTIRLAMYSDPNAGYSKDMHTLVKNGVSYASKLGMYVIIDWHILSDGNPNTYKDNAISFFNKMTKLYKDYDNVLYEICNEPNGNVTWNNDIMPYAKDVIDSIRKIDDDAIIICGTPTWSQDVDIVSKNPLKGYTNIVYALHFYAATHKENIQNKYKEALKNNLPILVSEFGICDASGNGMIDYDSANTWINLLRKNNTGYVCWNLSNKNESSSLIESSCNKLKDFTDNDLSNEGKWLKKTYNNK